MKDRIRIAIDGPSGSGKSTIAKIIARRLGFDYVDTGAMYRAIGYKIIRENIDLLNENQLKDMLNHTVIDFSNGNTILDGIIVNDKIRTPEVTKMASEVSALKDVREKLVALQRKMGQKKSLVMDGRDIGTNVFPDAEYKFFVTASSAERARRRLAELVEKGENVDLAQVEADINKRDYNDSTRELNPLKKASDALELDTTGLSIEETVQKILEVVKWQ